MRDRRLLLWVGIAWLALSVLGSSWLSLRERAQLRDAFETDARIIHRLLSQNAVQHEAVLATLALLQAPPEPGGGPEQRLPSLYAQILRVERHAADSPWPEALGAALNAAEDASRRTRQPALAGLDFSAGRYWLVLAAAPASYAMQVDMRAMVPLAEWPLPAQGAQMGLALEHDGQTWTMEPGAPVGPGLLHARFDFRKHLGAVSQPFEVVAWREYGWSALPWGPMLGWTLLVGLALGAAALVQGQRRRRQRAEELLRLGQIARLNTLGELAGGIAHELNQPLAAISANTQAARRLLDEDPPPLDAIRAAMLQAVGQSKRAAEVLGRLRQAIERPGLAEHGEAVSLHAAVSQVLYLLEPECARRGVKPTLTGPEKCRVVADPVALDQIIHNLLMNALQALDAVPEGARRLQVDVEAGDQEAQLRVADSGPGIPPESLPRLFEPFFTTKPGGLGLGLSLCETLATGMGGRLSAANRSGGGAEFRLVLPAASPQAAEVR